MEFCNRQPVMPAGPSIVPIPPPDAGIPLALLRPAVPTLKAALGYIRSEAAEAERRVAILRREQDRLSSLADRARQQEQQLQALLFTLGEED